MIMLTDDNIMLSSQIFHLIVTYTHFFEKKSNFQLICLTVYRFKVISVTVINLFEKTLIHFTLPINLKALLVKYDFG